jgi:SpoVK/Ycf46/Vps4 family AAA+-type ATPase
LVKESQNFTGAEIESSIEAAMYEAFSDNKRDITTKDILLSLKNSVPIAIIMKEEINALREWASERARSASISQTYARPSYDEDDL